MFVEDFFQGMKNMDIKMDMTEFEQKLFFLNSKLVEYQLTSRKSLISKIIKLHWVPILTSKIKGIYKQDDLKVFFRIRFISKYCFIIARTSNLGLYKLDCTH